MEILSIINGINDPELYSTIERYAFLDGFETCDLQTFLLGENRKDSRPVLIYLDLSAMEEISPEILHIVNMKYPVVVVPKSHRDMARICKDFKSLYFFIPYPFSFKNFREICRIYVAEELLAERIMCFGQLRIDKSRREVSIENQILEINGYSYEILLILIEHIGEVITREEINQYLPQRQRHSMRNVDTHIKLIRKQIGIKNMIKCIRSVGYCIPADQFYKILNRDA